jgi:hypothetical protein
MGDKDIINFLEKEKIEIKKTLINSDIEYVFYYGN